MIKSALQCIAHIDNVVTRVTGDIPVTFWEDLSLKMSYEIPGASYSKQFQNKVWDGRKRLFSKRYLSFPTGLFSLFREVCEQHGIEYQVKDLREIPVLGERLAVKGVSLRDYQVAATEAAFSKQRGMVRAPTGSGKSTMIADLVGRINNPTLVLIHKQDIFHQLVEELEDRLQVPIGKIGCGVISPERISVGMIQTIYRAYGETLKGLKDVEKDKTEITKPEMIRDVVENARCIVIDECFPAKTKVQISPTQWATIGQIYRSPNITHVLSYNEETKTLESRKIVRKIKSSGERSLIKIRYSVNGLLHEVTCTPNHKIWTSQGYKRADTLQAGDILKTVSWENSKRIFACSSCNFTAEKRGDLLKHIYKTHSESTKKQVVFCSKCSSSFSSKRALSTHVSNIHDHREEFLKGIKNRETTSWQQSLKEMGRNRLGKNNPIFRHPDTIEKMRKTAKKNFAVLPRAIQEAQIARFRKAPLHRKDHLNNYEQMIAELSIPSLQSNNGVDSKIFEFKTPFVRPNKKLGRNKIPDFICTNQQKVIEIADRSYWHTTEEMESITKRYNEIGYKCLVIYCDEIDANLAVVKQRIITFLKNHDAIVESIHPVKRMVSTVYNLEVESNHNYFADDLLVSNCHHINTGMLGYTLAKAEKAFYRFGFSATTFREDNADLVLDAHTGPRCVDISASELISRGFLAKPTIYLCEFDHNRPSAFGYAHMYEQQVVNNLFRNKLIIQAVLKAIANDKTCLIAVTRIDHGRTLEAMLGQCLPSKIRFANGQMDSSERKQILKDLNDRKISVAIATTVFGEGVNVPGLDVLINAKANSSSIDSLQLVGRALRKTHTKQEVTVIDIYDNHCKYLGKHAKDRLNIYRTEPAFTIKKVKGPEDIIFPR